MTTIDPSILLYPMQPPHGTEHEGDERDLKKAGMLFEEKEWKEKKEKDMKRSSVFGLDSETIVPCGFYPQTGLTLRFQP